jgi:hypothetical protein
MPYMPNHDGTAEFVLLLPQHQRRKEFGAIRTCKQKYNRGATPCHYCDTASHTSCRPRLDNRLCSCSCRFAAAYRAKAATELENNPGMSEQNCVRRIAPKMRPTYVGGDAFYPVDRSKDDPLENS